MLSAAWRPGCPEVFADEEAIETPSDPWLRIRTPRPEVFADEEAIETSQIPCLHVAQIRSPEVFADEEAIETGHHNPSPGLRCYFCPEVFADEEAIETESTAESPLNDSVYVRKYSLTKKRLRLLRSRHLRLSILCVRKYSLTKKRLRPGQADCSNLDAPRPEVFADEEAIET